jgi:hypothetical protein
MPGGLQAVLNRPAMKDTLAEAGLLVNGRL